MSSAVRRTMVLVAVLAVAASVTVASAQAQAQARTRPAAAVAKPPDRALSWMSAGDSYSSGEGVVGNKGACAQSELAYGPLAQKRLDETWNFSSKTFTACTGHLVGDLLSARAGTGKSALWDWGQREQGGPARVDLMTMSFGGNDIGFSSIIYSCLGIRPAFSELINPLCGDLAQMQARVDAMLDPTADGGSAECTKATKPSTVRASFSCPFKLPGRPKGGSIIDFYYDIVTKKLTSTGQLYVVGYPQLVAPVDQWASWLKGSCKGIPRAFVPIVRALGDHLNAKLKEAVRRTNQALGTERVIFIDRAAIFAKGGHELCGAGEDWLNGPAVDRGDWQVRIEQSFHPNAAGHATVATELAKTVDARFPRTPGGVATPAGPGRWSIQFTHPTWGPVTLTTSEPTEDVDRGGASVVVVDAAGKTRWTREADPLYTFRLLGTGLDMEHEDLRGPAIDKLGHIFINYNPGRYNGVGVLVPTKDGFDDLATVPVGEDYDQRFYSAATTDRNGDGTYEIRVFTNDCEPSCAGGTTTSEDFDWNGYDYSIGAAGLAECGHAELDDDYGDDNTISSLRVAKGSCGVAMALALRLANEHNFYDGPRTFRSGTFDCRAELYDEDYGLPSGGYECSDGTASVTWFKT